MCMYMYVLHIYVYTYIICLFILCAYTCLWMLEASVFSYQKAPGEETQSGLMASAFTLCTAQFLLYFPSAETKSECHYTRPSLCPFASLSVVV